MVSKSQKEHDSPLAEAMVVTIRQPLLVLNAELRVGTAGSLTLPSQRWPRRQCSLNEDPFIDLRVRTTR
jgi:hypothetical protein